MNFPIFAFPLNSVPLMDFNIYSYTFCHAALAAALMFLALPDVMAAGPADTSVTASGWYRHGRALAGQLPLHSPSGRYGLEPYPDHGYMDTVDGSPLFFDLSAASDTRMALGVSSSLSSGRKWSTEILGGLTGNVKSFDCNHDGFMDEPEVFRFNVANSWHYCADDGVRVSFGAGFMRHSGKEGQEGYDRTAYQELEEGYSDDPWGSDLMGMMADGYVSIYVPLADDNASGIGFSADYAYAEMNSWTGASSWYEDEHSMSADLRYAGEMSPAHRLAAGIRGTLDIHSDGIDRIVRTSDFNPETGMISRYEESGSSGLWSAGLYGEYAFNHDDRFGVTACLYGDWYAGNGFRLSPHLELRYSPVRQIEIRLDGGRRLRFVNPLEDNFDVFLTGKVFSGNFMDHTLEDAWDFNGSLKYQLPFGATDDAYVSVGYSRTSFSQQVIVDYERALNAISFYNLDGRRSYTDSFLAELHVVPFRRFIVTGMFRYSDPKVELAGRGLVTRPMVPLYGGELDLRYSTLRDMWIFDLRASVNGPCRVYDFMRNHRDADGNLMYADGRTPVYPALSVRITRKIGKVDIYIGGENLTGFRQKDILLGSRDPETGLVSPHQPSFDASAVWGPLMGARFYAGMRLVL